MLFVKKLPWASLFLFLFTYGVFGWLISTETRIDGLAEISALSGSLWLIGSVILLGALTLTAPFKIIQVFYTSWLKSDTRAFLSVIIGAFIAVIIVSSIEISIRILVLLSAGALVRIDLQTSGYSKWQAFTILVVVSIIGFSLGVIAHQLLYPKPHSLSLLAT
jgi:Na+/phosphate symporter